MNSMPEILNSGYPLGAAGFRWQTAISIVGTPNC